MDHPKGIRTSKPYVRRAMKVGLVVGTILAVINHYNMFVTGQHETGRLLQIAPTYLVPFLVSPYSMVTYQGMIDGEDR